jgi:protein SCO1/2
MRISAIVWIVCVLVAVGLLAWMGTGVIPSADRSAGQALIGGEFTLVDGKGKTVTDKDFHGQYTLVYFGFTHCPDICPTGLLLIANVLEDLGEDGKKITPLFISLDPERDTPEVVGNYVKHFSPRMVGLTGTPEQVKQAADAYKVYYRKVAEKDSAMDYVIDHSGYMYLMGPDGEYLAHFTHQTGEAALKDGLAKFVQ